MIRLSLRREFFVPWHPVPNCGARFVLHNLELSAGGLSVRLEAESGRQLTIAAADCVAVRTVALDGAEGLAVAVEQELAPFGRLWCLEESDWAEGCGIGLERRDELRHHVIATDDTWVEFLASRAVHASWDDNFFGDAV